MSELRAWLNLFRSWCALGLVLGLGCAERGEAPAASSAPPVGEADALFLAASRVALPPPVDPSVALPEPESESALLVARHCTACHAVPTPQIHSAADWPLVARRMWLRIDGLSEDYDIPRPTVAERTAILRYLSRHALQTSGAALPVGPGRNTYVGICGRCHELPDVHSHAAGDWGAVVARMQERMESMLGTTMDAEEQAAILGYLVGATQDRAH